MDIWKLVVPFCDFVINNATLLALVKKIINYDNRALFWVSFKVLIFTQMDVFIVLAATFQSDLSESRCGSAPDLCQL